MAAELRFSFGLPGARRWTTTDDMERRKALVEVARHLEMMALYERRFIHAVELRWEWPKDGEHHGCYRMTVKDTDDR